MGLAYQIQWRPGIGDPSFMGWFTVAAYALAALTCLLAAAKAVQVSGLTVGSRKMWIMVVIMMGLLCINKQLDLQSLITEIGRVISRKQGWYNERRDFQIWFVIGLPVIAFLATLCLAFKYRPFWKTHLLLASGIVFLLTFIVVRAISFHHVDALLKCQIAGVKLNWFLELSGIALIWLAAIFDCLNPKDHSSKNREPE